MKRIHLHGPTIRNDRSWVDAGATLTVGDKPGEISADRAQALVDGGTAIEEADPVVNGTPAQLPPVGKISA